MGNNFKLTYLRGFETESLIFQSNNKLDKSMIEKAQQILDERFGTFNICEIISIDKISNKEIKND